MNAKVGNERLGIEPVMGKHGCGKLNENGERLINICLNNKLVIGGTIFQHRDIHKLTWKSPDGKTVNQIDHVLINERWRSSLKDVRVVRGADMFSDHFLVGARLRLKLKAAQQNPINHTPARKRRLKKLSYKAKTCLNLIKEILQCYFFNYL